LILATPDRAVGIYVDGDYAYVADSNSGMVILNVSDLSNPQLLGTCGGFFPSPDPSLPEDIVVSGDYAFVADRSFYNGSEWIPAFWIANISDPKNPSIVAFQETADEADSIYISGDYAFVTIRSAGLEVYNISDPTNPIYVASSNFPGQAMGIDVSGDFLFVAASAGLQIINISNPSSPQNVSSYSTPDSASSVVISGNLAYVADSFSGLHLVNITDILNPTYAGFYDTPGNATAVFISGRNIYIADGNTGLQILRIKDLVGATGAGSYNTPDNALGIFVSGDYAYVADRASGVQIININDPTNPSYSNVYNTPDEANAVFISGDYAYIADAASGLQVIDISDPTTPIFVDSYNTPGTATDVVISGDFAYIADGTSGLQVLDISDPTNVTFVNSSNTPSYAYELSISGDYAYIADGLSGLQVINISDPASPTSAGSYNTPNLASDVFISGNVAYIADYSTGLISLNITNPTNPTYLDTVSTSGNAMGVVISGDYAYVMANLWGMVLVDISDPSSLIVNYFYYTTVSTLYGVVVSGDYAFLAAGANGLVTVEVMRNRYRQHEPMAIAQSLTIFSGSSLVSLVSANLTIFQLTPPSTSIEYYLSADNGLNWELVTPGNEHVFITIGNKLRWKANLTTSNALNSPIIYNLSISFKTGINSPAHISPTNGATSHDSTPTFAWQSIINVSMYLIQIDTLPSFDTIELINKTVFSPSFSPSSPLSDGTWYWRVGAFDSEGDIEYFSDPYNIIIFYIPLSSPTLISPINDSDTSDNTPMFSWSEVTVAVNYTLQLDTLSAFSSPDLITINGIGSTSHQLATPLLDGTWYWRVFAFDSDGNQGPYSMNYILNIDTVGSSTSPTVPSYSFELITIIIILSSIGVITYILRKRKNYN
jgi:hypothetical protein